MAVHRSASGPLDLTVDTASFGALFSRSSQVEPKLKTALRRRIRDAAKGLAQEVQQEARKPGEGAQVDAGSVRQRRAAPGRTGSSGLREGIAARVAVQIMTGQSREGVRISSSGLLAGAWQAQSGWRHPVFGNRSVWAQQRGRPGYFYRTIGRGSPRVKSAVEAAMTEAVASLGGGGS